MSSFKRKAKSQKGKRFLDNRAPKLIENEKGCLFLKGPSTSDLITKLLRDLHKLKGVKSHMFARRNMTRPFEDASSMEFFSQQNDTSLFCYGSHSKKRNNNLVFGRLFNHMMLDMLEVEASNYKSILESSGDRKTLVHIGSKPMFVFLGEEFTTNPEFKLVQDYMLDFFQGEIVQEVNLAGLKRVITCTALNGVIHFKHSAIRMKKSGTRYPKVELEDIGPCFDMKIRRVKPAEPEVMNQAMKLPVCFCFFSTLSLSLSLSLYVCMYVSDSVSLSHIDLD